MKLFFDEDNGTGIPRALRLVRGSGDQIHFPSDKWHQLVKKGTQDRDWIPVIGNAEILVFSQNKYMLNNEEERGLLIKHRVGIVYLSNGSDKAFPVLRMLMNKWEWLGLIDATIPRPFAYLVGLNGRPRKLDINSPSPLLRFSPKKPATAGTPPNGLTAPSP